MNENEGRRLHGIVEQTREAGDFWDALKLVPDVIKAYEEAKDWLGLSEINASVALIYRHIYKQTSNKVFLIFAEEAAITGIRIAKENDLKDALALPTFNLAKIQEEYGRIGEAAETYEEAVSYFESNPPQPHNRAGVLADMKVHLATCQYKAGDKSGLPRAITAMEDLEKSDEKAVSKYNYCVWMSGANMRIAEAVYKDDKELAMKHMEEARKIIEENIKELPDLKLRKGQWEKLLSSLN